MREPACMARLAFLFVTLTSLGLGANNMRMTALKMSFPRQGDFCSISDGVPVSIFII
jgi:hypothetical protein